MSPLHGLSITPELREQWLQERLSMIGGSEIASALGINQYDSQLRLWLSKTRRLPPKEITEPMEMGNWLEPVILEIYQHRTKNLISRTQVFYVSPTHDYLCATLDGITSDNIVVQVKNVGYQSSLLWGPDGTDEVPHAVILQAQQEMFCSGLELAHVVALIGGSELRIYSILRDDRIIGHIIKRGYEFIERVRNNIYPEPDPDRDHELVKYLFPACDGMTQFDGIQSNHAIRWDQVRQELKLLEKEEKHLKMAVSLAMGEASQAQLNNGQTLYRSVVTVPACTIERKGYSFPRLTLKGEPHDDSGTRIGRFTQVDPPLAP